MNSHAVSGARPVSRLDENYRSIGEVADSLGLPQHVLRFWETRFAEIKPLKRAGGRRLYRDSDVELVAAIKRMLYEDGYTIKGVQRILKEKGVAGVLEAEHGPPPPDFDAESPESSSAEPDASATFDEPIRPAAESLPPLAPPPVAIAPTTERIEPTLSPHPIAAPRQDRARLAAALAEIDECIRLLTVTRRN